MCSFSRFRVKPWSRPSSVKLLSWRSWSQLQPMRKCLGTTAESPAMRVRGGFTREHNRTASFCKFLLLFKKKACCVCLLGKDLSSKVLLRLCVFRSSESETERSLVHTLSPWCTGKQCTTIRSSRTSRGNSLCLREQSLTQSGRSVPFFLCLYLCVVFLA